MDDGLLERHGLHCTERGNFHSSVLIHETVNGLIALDGNSSERLLQPVQARYLARKLHRLARRIERRAED